MSETPIRLRETPEQASRVVWALAALEEALCAVIPRALSQPRQSPIYP